MSALDSMGGADDDVVKPRRRKADDTEMDITPMIDVTFLLLIYFVVASTMSPNKAVDLANADVGVPVAEKQSAVLIVTKAEGANGEAQVFLGELGGAKAEGSPAQVEDQIKEYVSEQLQDPGKNQVLILQERGTKAKHFDEVRSAVADVLEDGQPLNIGVLQEN